MGAQDRVLRVILYDKNWVRKGWVGNYVSLTVTERFLAQDSGEITVKATDPMLPAMMAPGARVRVMLDDGATAQTFFFEPGGNEVISGPLRDPAGSFLPGGTVTFQVSGDWRILRNTVARPIPGSPLQASSLSDPAQSYDPGAAPAVGADTLRVGYYRWPTGPLSAFQAAMLFIDDHVNRRWLESFGESPVFTGGFASSVDVSGVLPQVRMGTVEDYLVPLVHFAGDGLRINMYPPDVYASTGKRFLPVYWTPKTWPDVYTPDSGVLRDGTWSMKYPNATNIIVGGPGEDSARAFLGVNDATGLAAKFHDLVEVFRDATGAPVEWPTTLAEQFQVAKYYLLRPEITSDQQAAFLTFLQEAGADALADGAPTSGVSLTLAESEGFQFSGQDSTGGSTGFATGDFVTVAPSKLTAIGGLRFTEQIMQTTLSVSTDAGLTVTPQLGTITDDPDLNLAKAITAVASANNRRSTSQ